MAFADGNALYLDLNRWGHDLLYTLEVEYAMDRWLSTQQVLSDEFERPACGGPEDWACP